MFSPSGRWGWSFKAKKTLSLGKANPGRPTATHTEFELDPPEIPSLEQPNTTPKNPDEPDPVDTEPDGTEDEERDEEPEPEDEEPEFIYRRGDVKAKTLALTRPQDKASGLSFSITATIPSIKFAVAKLRAAGYSVRFDVPDSTVTDLWTGEVVRDGNGQPEKFGLGHVTVWHPSPTYWDDWYQADVANKGTPNISTYSKQIFDLREP